MNNKNQPTDAGFFADTLQQTRAFTVIGIDLFRDCSTFIAA
jgi:hypothetical protein